jgi:hypothetical protein
VLHAATLDTGGCGEALVPFLDAEVVRLMADARFRLKTAQGFTWTYFGQKHGLSAVPFLVPDALGKSRPARRKALAALWLIADEHGGLDEVVKAAGTHGPEAAEALAEALRADRPTPDVAKKPAQGPQKPPKLPWLDAATLPAPVLRATGQELPPAATGNLVSFSPATSRPATCGNSSRSSNRPPSPRSPGPSSRRGGRRASRPATPGYCRNWPGWATTTPCGA